MRALAAGAGAGSGGGARGLGVGGRAAPSGPGRTAGREQAAAGLAARTSAQNGRAGCDGGEGCWVCWEVNITLVGFFSSATLQYPRPQMEYTIDQILLMQDTIMVVRRSLAGTLELTISEIVSLEVDPVLFILLLTPVQLPSNGLMVNCHVSYAVNN